jgi:tetratricopeptide (TPR) repeat protein
MKKDSHKANKEREAFYDRQDEEIASVIIDDLMATEYATPPPGIPIPEAAWKEKKRHELQEQLSTKPFRNRFSQGLHTVVAQLREYLPRSELEKISEELAQGAEKFLTMIKSPPETAEKPNESLQDLLQISDRTIEQIYQCGVRLAKAQVYQDAADVFFVLSILDHQRHNIWMALGLSEQHLGHMEPALQAYAMAIITNIEDPWSYLHSAECYQFLGQKADAQECLEACLAHTNHLPTDAANRVVTCAEKCRAKM